MIKEKKLGEVAVEAYDRYDPKAKSGGDLWDYVATAVIAEHERRKAASEVPNVTEIGLWLGGKRVAAINTYSRRTGKPMHESYAAIAEAVKKP